MISGKETPVESLQKESNERSLGQSATPPPPASRQAPERKSSLAQRLFKRGSTGSPTSVDICLEMGDCSPLRGRKADKTILTHEETDMLFLRLEDGVLGTSSTTDKPGIQGSQ
jgi:hypothetical protein